jgi:ferredoxin
MAYVISKACTKCGACLPECPTGSIVEGKEQFFIDTDTCMDHATCVTVCPVDAIAKASFNHAPIEGEEEEEA